MPELRKNYGNEAPDQKSGRASTPASQRVCLLGTKGLLTAPTHRVRLEKISMRKEEEEEEEEEEKERRGGGVTLSCVSL